MNPSPTQAPPNQSTQIAQDALSQLRAKKLVARRMAYLEVEEGGDGEYLSGHEFREKTCNVCAKGALVVGYMTRQGDETLGYWDHREEELEDIFGEAQFSLIEACFEGYENFKKNVGVRYQDRLWDKKERLEAILTNIIRNDGTFVPEQDLQEAE